MATFSLPVAAVVVFAIAHANTATAGPSISRDKMPANVPVEVRQAIEGLYSEDAPKRLDAINALALMRGVAAPASPFLISMAADEVPVRVGDRTVVGYHIVTISRAAEAALVKIGPKTIPHLIYEIRKGTNANERVLAATALNAIVDVPPFHHRTGTGIRPDRAIVETWLDARDDEDVRIRGLAFRGLHFVGVDKPIDAMLRDIYSPDIEDRQNVVKVLGRLRIAEAVPALVRMVDGSLYIESRQALGQIGAPAVTPLVNALAASDGPEGAGWALFNIRDHAGVLAMLRHTKHEDRRVREWLANAFAASKDPATIPALLEFLSNDSDVEVRATAALAFREFANVGNDVRDALTNAKENDTSPRVRERAGLALDHLVRVNKIETKP